MTKLSIEDLELKNKRVLVRVDFNAPINSNLQVTDPTRIEAALPTIQYILEKGGMPILMSHFGRPKMQFRPELSLAPCAHVLAKLLDKTVTMAPNCIGDEVRDLVDAMQPGSILLLENLRFHRAEKHPKEAPDFAAELASYGDCYIDDAFGCAHREHSSITELPKHFAGKAAAGFLMMREIEALDKLLKNPKHPFVALIGGAKISSKIGILRSLAQKADVLLVGGGMSYTFLLAKGYEIGKSIAEPDEIASAKEVMQSAKKLLLPLDVTVVEEFSENAPFKVVAADQIEPLYEGVDIGPKTVELFSKEIKKAESILWNGPVGVFEFAPFAKGTVAIADAVANSSADSVVGGGDSIAAIKKAAVAEKITHISTGGGATLSYIEHGTLPGIEALSEKSRASWT